MKKLIALLLIFSFLSCSNTNEELVYQNMESITMAKKSAYSKIELNLLNCINNHRVSIGFSKLTMNNIVSGACETHNNYMIENKKLSHDNFDDRYAYIINNTSAKSVSENVGFGYSSAEDFLNGYLQSESHKKTIESSNFKYIGVSLKKNTSNRYYNTIILTY